MEELDFIDISRDEDIRRTKSGRQEPVRRQGQTGRERQVRRQESVRRQGRTGREGQVRRQEPVRRQGQTGRERQVQKQESLHWKERKQRREHARRMRRIKLMISGLMLLCIMLFCFILYQFLTGGFEEKKVKNVFHAQRREMIQANNSEKPVITEDFLTENPYSRPGERLKEVNNIFVHYTANRGTSAAQNRSYFENLGITAETSASAHFVIGYEGEIIQCLPLEEIGYAVKQRNYDSVSIECCYLNDDGKFTDETYDSLIRLCGWLLKEYKLTPQEVLRHYDEGGKKCPLYYVEHEAAWEQFLTDLEEYISGEEQV